MDAILGASVKLKKGDFVRHKKARVIRQVIAIYQGTDGGVRLDRPVDTFVSWNAADLTFVRHGIVSK